MKVDQIVYHSMILQILVQLLNYMDYTIIQIIFVIYLNPLAKLNLIDLDVKI